MANYVYKGDGRPSGWRGMTVIGVAAGVIGLSLLLVVAHVAGWV